MSFFADQQTLSDLNIPGRHKTNSILSLFNHTITTGGAKLLEAMFASPLTDAEAINQRSALFKYFAEKHISFPFNGEEFSIMENYLSSGGKGNLLAGATNIVCKKLLQTATQDAEYELLNAEVCLTIKILNQLNAFVNELNADNSPYRDELTLLKGVLNGSALIRLLKAATAGKIPLIKLIRYDYWLRTSMRHQMELIITAVFRLDVYIAVANVAIQSGFNYAKALPKQRYLLNINNLYHPAVENATGNTITMQEDCNVLFLTGANMAGKSTLMKAFGIGVYLAHMGFPIAADGMEFSVKNGLFSSINVSDNLSLGYSHFYAEVLRVKTVAEAVAADKDLIVIFDELFKGTNVKDAYDATFSITEAFAQNNNSFFVISTHITEVGEALRKNNNFKFVYLPTVMEGSTPHYTYQLTEGISTDKHGMLIIENEGILDLIKNGGK